MDVNFFFFQLSIFVHNIQQSNQLLSFDDCWMLVFDVNHHHHYYYFGKWTKKIKSITFKRKWKHAKWEKNMACMLEREGERRILFSLNCLMEIRKFQFFHNLLCVCVCVQLLPMRLLKLKLNFFFSLKRNLQHWTYDYISHGNEGITQKKSQKFSSRIKKKKSIKQQRCSIQR